MTKVVVYHPNTAVREAIVQTLRNAGHVTYDAKDPERAWGAVQILRPDAVITSFPARLQPFARLERTLTETIRLSPQFGLLPIINLTSDDGAASAAHAAAAGATVSLPASAVDGRLLETVQDLAGRLRSSV